jgi:hypothetical protein
VVNDSVDAKLIGRTLQLAFPQTQAGPVAAAAIGGDQQAGGSRISAPADLVPPPTDRLHREACRVMLDADADPGCIGGEIVDAVRHRTAQVIDQEIMHPHVFRLALRVPLSTTVLLKLYLYDDYCSLLAEASKQSALPSQPSSARSLTGVACSGRPPI